MADLEEQPVLKLILDHELDTPAPAVDRSPFACHGRVIAADFAPDGRAAGSGALSFTRPDAAVRIARGRVWDGLNAIAVEAWVKTAATGVRRNIVEGDGSFALFVDGDDTLVGGAFSFVDGAAGPAWNGVSSSAHSPDGTPRHVPAGEWCKVVFHHDGITRARLFIDDMLVGARGDYRSGVGPVAGAGVVIGNWTLADQYCFSGSIDRVRIFKRDEAAPIHAFTARPLDPAARDAWDDIWACLSGTLNVDGVQLARRMAREWEELMRELFRAVHAASPEDREAYRMLVDAYSAGWRLGAPDPNAIVGLRDWIERYVGDAWLAATDDLARRLIELLEGARCVDAERLTAADPMFAAFVTDAGGRL
jgi:hypothetical protein